MRKQHRRRWEDEEVRRLREGATRRAGVKRLAHELRRSVTAVRQKAFLLGLSLSTR